ncbi:MAG: 4Fe-4S dicluster domain-containing protein [Pseudomonadales bacterium]|nr:respiratory nitrate reductase subunit beta [Pseudomonadales bacterium]
MSSRQIAMVMDLNKCVGCHTCSVACKRLWTRREGMQGMWWNTVNTQPGRGSPRDWESLGGGFRDDVAQPGELPSQKDFGEPWEYKSEKIFYEGNPDSRLAPEGGDPDWGPNWDEDQGAGDYPNAYYFYLPRICNHCTHPACLEACPRGAIGKREEDGIVLIDEDRCRGYRFCMEACPYKKIYFNTVEGVSQKCIFCLPRVEQGVAPACARQCPGRVRFVGYLDDPEGPIHKLVHKYRVALPLHAEYGTGPNVFYVPPLSPPGLDAQGNPTGVARIPIDYLESLFGPRVQEVLDLLQEERTRRQRGEPSELMDLLISRRWLDLFSSLDRHPRDAAPVRILDPRVRT